MSFARNFAAGQQAAQGLIDTYSTARRNRDLGRVDDWKKSDEFDGFTAQDGSHMEAIASARDAEGKPYYNMQDDGRGGLAVQSNFSYAGADGQPVAPGATVGLQPRRVAEYGGQRYDAADLTPERMESLQDRERARIMGRHDPVMGLQMRRDMKRDEREDKRFGWEEQQQPLKQRALEQGVRTGEIQLGQSERALQAQGLVDEVAKMPIEALQQYASRLNTNASTLPFLSVGKTKEGYKFLTMDPETGATGKEFTVNDAQLRDLAAASVLGMAGYGQESMARLTAVNKDVADIVAKMNTTAAQTVSSGNDALRKGRQDDFEQQGLSIRRQTADQAGRYYDSAGRNLREYVDTKGNTVVLDVSKLPVGEDGVVVTPPGIRPKTARPEVTTKDVVDYAAQLQASRNPATGKPYTPEESMVEARRILAGQQDPFMAKLDALLGTGADPFAETKPAAAPRAGGLQPPRTAQPQITTIVPPRSGADMRPKPQLTDDDILLRYLSK